MNDGKTPIVELKGINKAFGGVRVLKNIDLSINPGDIVCLCGENGSGKSTIIKIISGVYTFDSGSLKLNGKNFTNLSSSQSIDEGIQVIYQDLSVFHNLTVAENISFSYRVQNKHKLVNYKFGRQLAKQALEKLGIELDLDQEVGYLSVAERQLVAISRAIAQEASLIIMDEPTTAITQREIEKLLDIIRGLKEQGIAVLFVSHKLEEVVAVCDRVIVTRNGEKVVDSTVSEFDASKIAYYMTGEEITYQPFDYKDSEEKPLIEVKDLSVKGQFENVSFSVKPGEILAIAGQLGSGRTELAETLFGLYPGYSGDIYIDGEKTNLKSRKVALRHGIAYLPEDRLTEGLFMNRSLGENFSAVIIDTMTKFGVVSERKIEQLSDHWINELRMSKKDYTTPANNYSGGNQQRIVLGKWLAAKPRIFILNCPTVGVDVKSKSEIHDIVKKLAEQGFAIIMMSDDIPEVISTSNRVLIMVGGKVTYECNTSEVSKEQMNDRILQAV